MCPEPKRLIVEIEVIARGLMKRSTEGREERVEGATNKSIRRSTPITYPPPL